MPGGFLTPRPGFGRTRQENTIERAAVENIGKTGFTIAGYLKNAFDEKYYVGGIPTGEVFSENTAVPGAPRTYFVEASFKF